MYLKEGRAWQRPAVETDSGWGCRDVSPHTAGVLPHEPPCCSQLSPPSLLPADWTVYKGTCPCGLGTRSWRGTRPSRSSPGRGNLLESCPAYLQCTCALNAPSRSGSSTSVSLFFCFFLQPQVQSVLDSRHHPGEESSSTDPPCLPLLEPSPPALESSLSASAALNRTPVSPSC